MKRPKFVVYQAKDGYRWRLVAANGRIVADSGEAYTRKRDAERAAKAVKSMVKRMDRQILPLINDAGMLVKDGARIGFAPGRLIGNAVDPLPTRRRMHFGVK